MWNLRDLSPQTRERMLQELDQDVADGRVFISPRLTELGATGYAALLREAFLTGTPETLAGSLLAPGTMRREELSHRGVKVFTKAVPRNAHETLAEGEFNRYYIRAVCRRAIERECGVVVYRAKSVAQPRPESERLIGRPVSPSKLLDDLRQNVGVETAFGIPAGPNSGLSVALVLAVTTVPDLGR